MAQLEAWPVLALQIGDLLDPGGRSKAGCANRSYVQVQAFHIHQIHQPFSQGSYGLAGAERGRAR